MSLLRLILHPHVVRDALVMFVVIVDAHTTGKTSDEIQQLMPTAKVAARQLRRLRVI